MKGNQMRRNHLLKYTALLFLAGGLLAATPVSSFANNDVGKGASKKYMQSGSEQSSTEQNGAGQNGAEQNGAGQNGTNWQDTQLAGTGEGTDPGVGIHGSGVTEVAGGTYASLDQDAPAATGAYGYSIHPLYAISNRETSYQTLDRAFFTVEGDPKYLDTWIRLLQDCGCLRLQGVQGRIRGSVLLCPHGLVLQP